MDMVTILDSFQTPFFSSAPKIRVRDPVHSWVTDTLAATSTAGTAEGVDFLGVAITAPARLSNNTMIFSKAVVVSDRERESNVAGIRDMYEHQVMKAFKELARNYEATVFASSASATASGDVSTPIPPRMGGFRTFAIWASGGSGTAVVSADITRLSEQMYTGGAEPDSIWFSPPSKRQFVSNVAGTAVNTRNIAAADKRIIANVDIYETPFGQIFAVITDRFIVCNTVTAQGAYYIGDRSLAKVGLFRPPQHKPMGKGGDHTRGLVLMEATFQIDHPSAWGVMSGVTNA